LQSAVAWALLGGKCMGMKEQDKRVLESFASRIRQEFPEARIWAFGSRARGDAQSESDYDMCVVIDRLDDNADRRISDIAFEVGWENEVLITTVRYSCEQFERGPWSVSPLVLTVLREGVPA
jgi:predicted nucleotidyltransferase